MADNIRFTEMCLARMERQRDILTDGFSQCISFPVGSIVGEMVQICPQKFKLTFFMKAMFSARWAFLCF